MPRSPDLAIFVLMTDEDDRRQTTDRRQTKPITLPLAHARGVKIAFSKYPALCKLEAHHGVNVGIEYNNEHAAKTFRHCIAETRRQDLASNLASAKFFSLPMDGTCDSGNIDDEMLLVVWCDTEASDEMVHTRMTYLHWLGLRM